MDWKKLGKIILEAAGREVIGNEVLSSITKVRDGIADEEDKALALAFYAKINKRRVAQLDADIKRMTAERTLLLQNKIK